LSSAETPNQGKEQNRAKKAMPRTAVKKEKSKSLPTCKPCKPRKKAKLSARSKLLRDLRAKKKEVKKLLREYNSKLNRIEKDLASITCP